MCMNCGCGQPDEKHGNEANITLDELRAAGDANGQSLDETARNIRTTVDQVKAEAGSPAR